MHYFSLPSSLTALDLSRSGATNKTLDSLKLSTLSSLHKLVLQEIEMDDNGIRYINTASLHELDLSLNNITDAGMPFLPSTIRKLVLHNTSQRNAHHTLTHTLQHRICHVQMSQVRD